MRVYSVSEARQKLAEVLELAKTEDVMIRHKGGEQFIVSCVKPRSSPFDIPGIERGHVTTKDIVEAVRESRAQPWRNKRG